MDAQKQRIAIAEACGWKECRKTGSYPGQIQGMPPTTDNQRPAPSPHSDDKRSWYWIPDYLSDLNAMHEAEKALTDDQFFDYLDRLTITAGKALRGLSCATAAQRAEAFLRTIGKWEDE